jgi:hypothetical protein
METLSETSFAPEKYLLVTEELMYYKLGMRHRETGDITAKVLSIPRGLYKYCFCGVQKQAMTLLFKQQRWEPHSQR